MQLQTLIVPVLAAAMGAGFVHMWASPTATVVKEETALQRILRTGTIRCGYNDWQPFFAKNPNTGVPEGFMVDVMNAIAAHAKLNVEWVAPIDWGNIPADLAAGKADTFCAAVYANTVRAKGMLFTQAIGHQSLQPFVRATDNRFTGTPDEAFNHAEIRVIGWEGTPTLEQAKGRFPNISTVVMPLNADTSQAYLSVQQNKADVFFSSMADAKGFMDNNPNTLKRLPKEYYLGTQDLGLNAALGEHDLISFYNTALQELRNDGTLDKLYQKYAAQVPDFMYLNE
ncbi:MAG: transporter substrate-binding domain-containing protein [Alphaproteobacteria bacterium]